MKAPSIFFICNGFTVANTRNAMTIISMIAKEGAKRIYRKFKRQQEISNVEFCSVLLHSIYKDKGIQVLKNAFHYYLMTN